MITIVDAGSLYLGSKALSQSMIDEFTAQWFEPMNKMMAAIAVQKVKSSPVLERLVSQDEEASSLMNELGG
jgi:ribonuclease PH